MVKQNEYNDEIDLATIVKIIWKRKKIIILGTLIVLFASLVILLIKNSKYSQRNLLYVADIIDDVSFTGVNETVEINRIDINILKMLSKYEYEKNLSVLNSVSKFNQQVKIDSGFKNFSFNLTCDVFKYRNDDSKEIIKVKTLIFKSNGTDVKKVEKYNDIVSDYLSNELVYLFINKYTNILKINYNQYKADRENILVDNHKVIEKNKYFLSSIEYFKRNNTNRSNHWVQVGRKPVVIVGEDIDLRGIEDNSFAYMPIEQQISGRKIIIKAKEQEIVDIEKELREYSKVISLLEKGSKEIFKIINNEYINKIKDRKIKINLQELLVLKDKLQTKLVFKESPVKLVSTPLYKKLLLVFFISLFIFTFLVFVLDWYIENKKKIFGSK